jgi:catechol 2,3-dioxygenase-like lactoylglutathione lyase family enzyme
MRLDHVGISVESIDRAIAFYTELLGMELLTPVFPLEGSLYEEILALEGVKGRMCVVRKGALQLELFEFDRPSPASKDANYAVSDRGISHFGIQVDDIDATYERLSAAGVRFHCSVKTFPRGVKATYGRDMDGNVFELVQMAPAEAS